MKSSSVLIAALLLLAACKKEYSVENVPQPPKQEPQPISNTEVLTVGSILETINRAAYWVDSNFFYVEPTSKEYSIAYGIEKYNGTIITVGESGLPTRPLDLHYQFNIKTYYYY
ncbi:MAG TPA: hypothetical protein PK772_07690, partial [Chitinophagaceae bacterium]|nr:hypothetical protein [Chitinophagaceae bacterium]